MLKAQILKKIIHFVLPFFGFWNVRLYASDGIRY
jgi:hypothetical protein